MKSVRRLLPLAFFGLLFCQPAFADFGPQVAHTLWLLLTFVCALIALPCIAPRGWRLFWFLFVLIGYPLSMALLGRFVMWVDTAKYDGDSTFMWLTIITWAWIACVVIWKRMTGSPDPAASGGDSINAPRPLPHATDLAAIVTIAALLFDGQLLVPRLTSLDVATVLGLTTAYVAVPLIAVMGLWRQQRWAWWLATTCAVVWLSTTIHFNFTALSRLVEPQAEGIFVQAFVAINNPALLSLALRVALLYLLVFRLRPRSIASPASAQ